MRRNFRGVLEEVDEHLTLGEQAAYLGTNISSAKNHANAAVALMHRHRLHAADDLGAHRLWADAVFFRGRLLRLRGDPQASPWLILASQTYGQLYDSAALRNFTRLPEVANELTLVLIDGERRRRETAGRDRYSLGSGTAERLHLQIEAQRHAAELMPQPRTYPQAGAERVQRQIEVFQLAGDQAGALKLAQAESYLPRAFDSPPHEQTLRILTQASMFLSVGRLVEAEDLLGAVRSNPLYNRSSFIRLLYHKHFAVLMSARSDESEAEKNLSYVKNIRDMEGFQ